MKRSLLAAGIVVAMTLTGCAASTGDPFVDAMRQVPGTGALSDEQLRESGEGACQMAETVAGIAESIDAREALVGALTAGGLGLDLAQGLADASLEYVCPELR